MENGAAGCKKDILVLIFMLGSPPTGGTVEGGGGGTIPSAMRVCFIRFCSS